MACEVKENYDRPQKQFRSRELSHDDDQIMQLRNYQKVGAKFLAERKRAALWCEMGTGKTCQALAAVKALGLTKYLVVSPAYLRDNWLTEAKKIGAPEPTVISYNFVQDKNKVCGLGKFPLVIADEAQALKNWNSLQTKNFIFRLLPKCERVWLLTGTPSSNSAADLHSLLSILEPGKWGKFGPFVERFCYKKEVGFGRWAREEHYGWREPDVLKKALLRVGLRRKLSDVEKEIPEVVYSEVSVSSKGLPKEDREKRELDPESEERPDSALPVMRRIGRYKAEALSDFILEFKEPLVIWCWFKETIEYLYHGVLVGRSAAVISGDQSMGKRTQAIKDFQNGDIQYLVCQEKAAGTGLTMTAANKMLVIDLPYSAADYSQMVGRLRRIGQTKTVVVYEAICRGTIDDSILGILRRKDSGMEETHG